MCPWSGVYHVVCSVEVKRNARELVFDDVRRRWTVLRRPFNLFWDDGGETDMKQSKQAGEPASLEESKRIS